MADDPDAVYRVLSWNATTKHHPSPYFQELGHARQHAMELHLREGWRCAVIAIEPSQQFHVVEAYE